MTPEQKALVQESWAKVIPVREQAAKLFYARLFATCPELVPYFKGDMTEQGRKLMAMLNAAVMGLDNLPALLGVLRDAGRRHAGYGVKDEDYDKVGAAFLWTLASALGTEFTPQTKDAWIVVYTTLADVMKDAAAQDLAA